VLTLNNLVSRAGGGRPELEELELGFWGIQIVCDKTGINRQWWRDWFGENLGWATGGIDFQSALRDEGIVKG
jgi:hypothetical protein